jgi:protein PsiE
VAVKIENFFAWILKVAMFLLGIVMLGFLLREIWYLGQLLLEVETARRFAKITDTTIAFFLYFEFIFLVKEFFNDDEHIALEDFLYIGITALVRVVLVHHSDGLETFWLTMAILVLVVALVVLRWQQRKNKKATDCDV